MGLYRNDSRHATTMRLLAEAFMGFEYNQVLSGTLKYEKMVVIFLTVHLTFYVGADCIGGGKILLKDGS